MDATIEHIVLTEEPHYQLPSSEPVPPIPLENEYSLPEPNNTYDVPRTIETPSVENIQISIEEKVSVHSLINQFLFYFFVRSLHHKSLKFKNQVLILFPPNQKLNLLLSPKLQQCQMLKLRNQQQKVHLHY